MIGKLCPTCGAANCRVHRPKTAAARGYDKQWGRFTRRFLELHPFCEWPDGCSERAAHVHHLDGLGPTGPRGYDEANCQSLCNSHHSTITAQMIKAETNVI